MHVNEMSMKMKLGFGKLVLGSFRMFWASVVYLLTENIVFAKLPFEHVQ